MDPILLEHLTPLIGEFAWHTLVVDPRIAGESQRHFNLVKSTLNQYSAYADRDLHILEVACYAHTTGYDLARELGAQVTLFELSRHSLGKGRELAGDRALPDNPRLVIGDFHELPFEDDSFNYVFICSALHHTWRFETVLKEMMRVLAPGGLLFLENEPTHRGMCFYKFRCNRPHEFTGFEHELEKLGIIRTVAEPYLGSRPEGLFGMIENQNMPLSQILSVIGQACDLTGLGLFPETVMGPLEHRWLQSRFAGAALIEKDIMENLQERIDEAAKQLTAAERGMGFSLPTPEEVALMAKNAGQAIAGLEGNPNSLGFRIRLSEIFGAPLQLVARKRDPRSGEKDTEQCLNDPVQDKAAVVRLPNEHFLQKAGQFKRRYALEGGMFNGFAPHIREILSQQSLIPEMHTGNRAGLEKVFPDGQWHMASGAYELIAMENISHDLLSVTNNFNRIEVRLPELPDHAANLVLLLRIHCQLEDKKYFRLAIRCGDLALDEHQVFKTESILCRNVLTAGQIRKAGHTVTLDLQGIPPEPDTIYHIAVAYAGLFLLAESGALAGDGAAVLS